MRRRNGRVEAAAERSRRGLRCEPLETRQLLAADVGITSVDSGVLTVLGDRDAANLNDTIVVQPVAGDASMIEVVVNGAVTATRSVDGLRRIVIAGGLGDDTIRIDVPDLAVGCTIRGGVGADTISGGPRGDRIHGGEGDDSIDGGDGNDEIVGGLGNDYLRGGTGADRIVGGDGADDIDGGLGNDVLVGGEGDDTLDGEAGIDVVHGGNGDDTLLGGTGRDRLFAGGGVDRLFGITGRDRFVHDTLDSLTETELANPLMLAASEAEIRRWLLGRATRWHHEAVFGSFAFGAPRMSGVVPTAGGVPIPVAGVTTTGGDSAPTSGGPTAGDHSTTNNQVAGVDEADRVRTDGRYIYLLDDGELVVIDADPASLAIVSRTPIAGYGSVLYLHGDRITVLSQVWDWSWPIIQEPLPTDPAEPMPLEPSIEATVMPTIWPPIASERYVKVTVIDVADRANPVVLEETRIDGTLAASRSIGTAVTLVVENRPQSFVRPMPMPFFRFGGGSLGAIAFFDADSGKPDDFRTQIMTADLASLLPVARSTTASGEITQQLVEPGKLYLPVDGGGDELLSIVTLTPTDDTPGIDRSVSTLGLAGTVYASVDSIIIAAADYGSWWGSSEGATTLHEFSLANETLHVASGTVPGIVIDQFAIDAHADGTVRVVTQTGWGRDASTNLFVLESQDGAYVEVGGVKGIAPGENTMSARFVGDTAYVVTFEQVDPLFVIDLADPTRPTVVGELVIPGFSSYLHALDAEHLLGIGRSADLSGVKLSLFDVSTPSTPAESSFVEIVQPGVYASSEAEHDHHAFSYFADRGIVAIPVTEWSYSSSHALVVYSVGLADGTLEELARIEHDSPVSRSLRIGERLFSISETAIKIVDFADPATVVAELPLTPPTVELPAEPAVE